jgi:hypothetical protein
MLKIISMFLTLGILPFIVLTIKFLSRCCCDKVSIIHPRPPVQRLPTPPQRQSAPSPVEPPSDDELDYEVVPEQQALVRVSHTSALVPHASFSLSGTLTTIKQSGALTQMATAARSLGTSIVQSGALTQTMTAFRTLGNAALQSNAFPQAKNALSSLGSAVTNSGAMNQLVEAICNDSDDEKDIEAQRPKPSVTGALSSLGNAVVQSGAISQIVGAVVTLGRDMLQSGAVPQFARAATTLGAAITQSEAIPQFANAMGTLRTAVSQSAAPREEVSFQRRSVIVSIEEIAP